MKASGKNFSARFNRPIALYKRLLVGAVMMVDENGLLCHRIVMASPLLRCLKWLVFLKVLIVKCL